MCKTRAKNKPEKTHARSTPQVFTPTWRRCNDSDTVAVMAIEAYDTMSRPLQKGVQLCAPRCPRHLAFLCHAAYRLRTHASLPCPKFSSLVRVYEQCEGTDVNHLREQRACAASRRSQQRGGRALVPLPSILCIGPPPSLLALLPFPFLLWLSAGNQTLLPAELLFDALPAPYCSRRESLVSYDAASRRTSLHRLG